MIPQGHAWLSERQILIGIAEEKLNSSIIEGEKQSNHLTLLITTDHYLVLALLSVSPTGFCSDAEHVS